MSVEVRAAAQDELLSALRPIWLYFGSEPREDRVGRVTDVLEEGRLHAAFEGGEAVGGAGAFTFELTVPGGRVPAAGVTVVGVLPTHRRRGVLTALMRAQLDDVRERGEPVAYLWASEGVIYGRYGYGVASLCGEMDLPRAHGAFSAPVDAEARVRLADRETARELVPPVYERVALQTPGMFSRTGAWWETRVLDDPEWRRFGAGELMYALLERDGRPEAYALYRIRQAFQDGASASVLEVVEAMGATPAAEAAVWRFLLDVDWMDRVQAWLLPVDHPLGLLLVEQRRMRFRLGDALSVRLVDVEAALAGRGYAGDGEVVVEVRDAFCPWNDGRYLVGASGIERTQREADLRLGVDALGSVYLGGFTWRQLWRAGRVEELAEGAVERADRLFRAERAPWCPEIF